MNKIEVLISKNELNNSTIIDKKIMLSKEKIVEVVNRNIFTIYFDEILQIYIVGFDLLKYNTRYDILSNGHITHNLKEAHRIIDSLELPQE